MLESCLRQETSFHVRCRHPPEGRRPLLCRARFDGGWEAGRGGRGLPAIVGRRSHIHPGHARSGAPSPDLQRYDEAIEVAQQITELDPDDVLAHPSLSVLYQKKGMIPEAEAEGAKARVLGWKQQLKKS